MMMTKAEYIQNQSGICQAQKALEAAYAHMKRTVQWDRIVGNGSSQDTPTTENGRILQARRRLRREYQRACRAYDEKISSRKRSVKIGNESY